MIKDEILNDLNDFQPKGRYTKEENQLKGKYKNQISPIKLKFFDLRVLDRYKNDPRFKIIYSGVSGWLSIKGEFYNNKETPSSEKIAIQSFGRGFKEDGSEVIVTYLHYLAKLSEEHQKHWMSFEVKEQCKIDKDFYNQEFMAEFTDRVTPFEAILQEIVEINKLCKMIGYSELFKKEYEINNIENFDWISLPTRTLYYNLIHTLDKIFSENINEKFFTNQGIKTEEKGTITLLEEWTIRNFRPKDPEPLNKMFKILKQIRKERQTPAHRIAKNEYNKKFFSLQKELIYDTYGAIRTYRLMLMNYPKTSGYNPPEWLQIGNII